MVFPKASCCRFPFGTCGVSLLGPCRETETKGASPSYTLPPQPCLGTAHQSSLEPTAREVPVPVREQSQRVAGGEGKGRAASSCLAQTGFLCSAPRGGNSLPPTSRVPGAPHWGVLDIVRWMIRTDRGSGWSSSHPQVLPSGYRHGYPTDPLTTAISYLLSLPRNAVPLKLGTPSPVLQPQPLGFPNLSLGFPETSCPLLFLCPS